MEKKGFIFLCSDITEPECFKRKLFGGKEKYANRVKGLEIGDHLYLYNYNSKKLHGIFESTSEVTENIQGDAWEHEFPCQVKVKQIKKCKPLSRDDIASDDYLNDHIKFDRAGRPSSRLVPETVEYLEWLLQTDKRVRVYEDGAKIRTEDGHYVRSKPEKQIDDWLYANRIVHAYETAIPGAKRCDFEIPRENGSIYIEYWGLNSRSYLRDKKAKQKIYKEHDLKLIELEQKDLKNLDKVLGEKFLSR